MAMPAASSLAEFTRMPDDSRAIEVASSVFDELRFRCAVSDATFVLMVCAMVRSVPCSVLPRCGVWIRLQPGEGLQWDGLFCQGGQN